MEASVVKVNISAKRMMSEKTYRESQLAVIVSTIIALLNSYGGNLNLKFEDDAVSEEEADSVLRMIEQRLIDTIGLCTYNNKVKMPQLQKSRVTKQLVLVVERVESLCTVNYNLYLPTQKQVNVIPPHASFDKVKAILNREVHDREQSSSIKVEDFKLNKQVSFTESNTIQFKFLKSERSKCVDLGKRMTNKGNKLERYISAFPNKDGGKIFFGIANDGTVKGEVIMEQKDQEEIVRKVSKVINQMTWCGGKLEKAKHWDIEFVPVKDEKMNEIPSLFVIIVSVAPLRGGLFTKEPESYHVVHGRVERMSFTEWRSRFYDVDKQLTKVMVPSFAGRTQWCSVKTQKICHTVVQKLQKYQNDGDFSAFDKFAAHAEQNYKDIEVKLFILGERSSCAYKRGHLKKAESLLTTIEDLLSTHKEIDVVFLFRAIYAKSAIYRAAGRCEESYAIAKEGLQLAERVPAGILTAWFYNHVAIVEKLLSQQPKAERVLLVQSAHDHFIKALQHTQASSVEQEFATTIADLQQRIHIFRAITLLGDFASGANFRKVTPADIKQAQTDLLNYYHLIVEGYSVTSYREIYHLFAKSDLCVCHWWQRRKYLQRPEGERSEDGEKKNLLKQAFDYATEAKELSMKYSFEELTIYAYNRLAVITEIIIKLKVSSIHHPIPSESTNSV